MFERSKYSDDTSEIELFNEEEIQVSSNDSGFFIPDLCQTQSVFIVVLVSELLAFMIALVQFHPDTFWLLLGRYSIIIQWIALLSTALLCTLRPILHRWSNLKAGLISYLLVMSVTLLIMISAIWLEAWLQGHSSVYLLEHSGLMSSLLISAILSAIVLRFFYIQAQYKKRVGITADVKLQALQARIQPHFLFNSMNVIAGLIHVDPDLAEKLIEDLSDLFRASLAENRSQVRLRSEIELCERYLGIEQLRLGDRLRFRWQLPKSMDSVAIPPLTIQPLIENAIYHGIQPLVEGGEISLSVSIVDKNCIIIIKNPLQEKNTSSESGNRIAIDNIRARLDMLYGDQANLDMQIHQSRCMVTLTIPCVEMDDENTDS